MPFHFCSDELILLLSMFPFIGFFFKKLHSWWHKNSLHKCHEEHCHDVHVEHIIEAPANPIEEWDEVDLSLVEERFGTLVIDNLLLKYNLFIIVGWVEFNWFLNNSGTLKATFHNRNFIHNEPYGWLETL